MRYSNLHTHSTYSDGTGTLRENVEAAVARNMVSLGFSDHSFTACDPSYCMKIENYGSYIREARELKEEYRDRISLFLGIEWDYYSVMEKSLFDYTIASVHYIIKDDICYPIDHSPQQQKDCIQDAFGGSVIDMAKCYYELLTEHVMRIRPTFVGHFDVINKFSLMPEESAKYRDVTLEAMREIMKVCPYFELNTGAIARGWRMNPYPNDYLLEYLRDNGGEVLINGDTHKPENMTFYFDESVRLLRDLGFDHISMLGEKGFYKVKI